MIDWKKRFGSLLVKSISVLTGICWCGHYYDLIYYLKLIFCILEKI